jgi:hypothetical protein
LGSGLESWDELVNLLTKGQAEGARRDKESKWEMRKIERGRVDRIKNRSGKCEGLGERVDKLKNWSEKCEGLRGGLDRVEPNIVEITHLCIMHGSHTSTLLMCSISQAPRWRHCQNKLPPRPRPGYFGNAVA